MTEDSDNRDAIRSHARQWGCIFAGLGLFGMALAGIIYLIFEG